MVVASIAVLSLMASLMSDGLTLCPPAQPLPPSSPEPPPPLDLDWSDVVPGGFEDVLRGMPAVLATTGAGVAWWLAKNHMYKRLGQLLETKMAQYALEDPAAWRVFWKKVVTRFGLRGAAAAAFIGADGPLPIGDLIALGLTIWMLYDLYLLLVEAFGS